jgi:hypothetical protein
VEVVSYSDKVLRDLGETQSTTQEFAVEMDAEGDESVAPVVEEMPVVAEMQAFGSKEDDAATKLQSLQRAKSNRKVVVKEFMTQTGSCLAMPGTVQGKSGYYEMWANDLDTTLVAKFDVSEEGKWALSEGPWTMKEWVVVKQKNKEWFAARATAALKIQTLSRSKAARNNLVKAVGTQLGHCLAMPGTTQGKSGYYEMWVERYEMKMVAAMIVSEDGDWTLDSGPWTQKEWVVVRRWTPKQQQAAETVRMTMEARNRRTLAAKAMGATAKAVALPGTLQGGSGYYELRNDGQSSTVARYDIDGAGQWMLIEGPWPMNTWKVVQARTPEEAAAAGKAGREAFQAILASRTHAQAASKVQSLYRARSDRSDVVKRLNAQGTCMALPGTVQGRHGYYEMWVDESKTTLVARFDVTEDDEWTLLEGPWTQTEWAVARRQGAQRQVMADHRQKASSKIQAMCRGRLFRIKLVREMGRQLGSCLALPGTMQGSSGFYEIWAEEQSCAMVARFEVDENDDWSLAEGPWLNAEFSVLKKGLMQRDDEVPSDETPLQMAVRKAVKAARAAADCATRRQLTANRVVKRTRKRDEDNSARMLQNFQKICKSKGVAYGRRVQLAEQSSTLVPLPGTLQGKSGWFMHPWDESCIYYTRDEDGDFNEECRLSKFEWESCRKTASASNTLCAMSRPAGSDTTTQLMMNKRG